MKDKILEAVQISKTYGEGESAVHALRNSDLTLENGTFASIIGSSGSGKSTLLKILGGLLPPTTGKVLLDGQDIYAMNAEQLAQVRRQKIGFIFQDFRLFPEYTVRDNILIPFYLDHRAPDEQMLHKLTGILGIAGKLHSRPAQLSGGQQQRVAIARALSAQRPPGMALAAYRPLPGCAAVDCSRGTGGHSRIYEPAGEPAPLLRARGEHRVCHNV